MSDDDGVPKTTSQEWEIEWRAQLQYMREEPGHWISKRWRLVELRAEPPEQFRRAFVELIEAAGNAFHPAVRETVLAKVDYLVADERLRQLRAEASGDQEATTAAPRRRVGPPPMTTAEEVEAMRRELTAKDLPSGERPIAAALGVSRDAVRYALGKDR